MRRVLLLLAIVGLARDAAATVLPDWDLAALVARAETIVVGRVDSAASYAVGDRVLTDTRVHVERTLLGVPRDLLTVTQLGGELDGVVTEVLGTAPLARGRRYLFILYRAPDGRRYPVGMSLGVYAVDGEALRQAVNVPLVRGGQRVPPADRQTTLGELERLLGEVRR